MQAGHSIARGVQTEHTTARSEEDLRCPPRRRPQRTHSGSPEVEQPLGLRCELAGHADKIEVDVRGNQGRLHQLDHCHALALEAPASITLSPNSKPQRLTEEGSAEVKVGDSERPSSSSRSISNCGSAETSPAAAVRGSTASTVIRSKRIPMREQHLWEHSPILGCFWILHHRLTL